MYILPIEIIAAMTALATVRVLGKSTIARSIIPLVIFGTLLYVWEMIVVGKLLTRDCSGYYCFIEEYAVLMSLFVSTPIVLVLFSFILYRLKDHIKNMPQNTSTLFQFVGMAFLIALGGVSIFTFTEPTEKRVASDSYAELLASTSSLPVQPHVTVLADLDQKKNIQLSASLYTVALIKKAKDTYFFAPGIAESNVYAKDASVYKSCKLPYGQKFQGLFSHKIIDTATESRILYVAEVTNTDKYDRILISLFNPFTCEQETNVVLSEYDSGFSTFSQKYLDAKVMYANHVVSLPIIAHGQECTLQITGNEVKETACGDMGIGDRMDDSADLQPQLINNTYYLHDTLHIDYDGDGVQETLYGITERPRSGADFASHEVTYALMAKDGKTIIGAFTGKDSPQVIAIGDLNNDGREDLVLSRFTPTEGEHPQKQELLFVEFK